MPAETRDLQLAAVRREIAPALPRHVDAPTVELAAFTAVGRRELALALWTDARTAAEDARRSTTQKLRGRFGARNPRGPLSAALVVAAICAAVAAVLAGGVRFDPAGTAVAVVVLSLMAAAPVAIAMIAAAGKPLSRALIRSHAVVAIGLVVAASFDAVRGLWPSAGVVAGCAAVAVLGFIVLLVTRARHGAGAEEIDTAINVAYADTEPEVEAVSLRLRDEAVRALSSTQAERIVDLRTQVLGDLAAEGIRIDAVDASLPAGAVIIDDVLSTWIPKVLRGPRGL